MRRSILVRAVSIMAFPAMFGLGLACGAPPPSAAALPPAETVAPIVPVSITPGNAATQATIDPPTLPANAPTKPAPTELAPTKVTVGPVATAVPTAVTLPTPTQAPPLVQPTATKPPTVEPAADPLRVQADIVDFILPDISISAGTTVIWTNLDVAGHTATSGKDGTFARFDDVGWDSRGLDLDEVFSVTFTQPGVFPYTCVFHPWMNATVTVEASSR